MRSKFPAHVNGDYSTKYLVCLSDIRSQGIDGKKWLARQSPRQFFSDGRSDLWERVKSVTREAIPCHAVDRFLWMLGWRFDYLNDHVVDDSLLCDKKSLRGYGTQVKSCYAERNKLEFNISHEEVTTGKYSELICLCVVIAKMPDAEMMEIIENQDVPLFVPQGNIERLYFVNGNVSWLNEHLIVPQGTRESNTMFGPNYLDITNGDLESEDFMEHVEHFFEGMKIYAQCRGLPLQTQEDVWRNNVRTGHSGYLEMQHDLLLSHVLETWANLITPRIQGSGADILFNFLHCGTVLRVQHKALEKDIIVQLDNRIYEFVDLVIFWDRDLEHVYLVPRSWFLPPESLEEVDAFSITAPPNQHVL